MAMSCSSATWRRKCCSPTHRRMSNRSRPTSVRFSKATCVRIADAIDYDYARSFGKPDFGYAMRSLTFDRVLREWLRAHPGGQVVALGEGLETQYHRVDDGLVRWLSIDLPEALAVRSRFLP